MRSVIFILKCLMYHLKRLFMERYVLVIVAYAILHSTVLTVLQICEYPFDVGLLELSHSTKIVKEVLKGEKEVSPEVASLLRELVEQVGGEQVLDYPAAWYDEQLAEDYKTALQFYKDFCAAASTEDEAQAVAKLKELEQLIGYFAAKGEGEIWRVNKLAYFFHATLTSLREYELSPYPEPVLQAKLRTPARMKALQMFTNAFPALKELLYR